MAEFLIGTAKRDITPTEGVNLYGGVSPYPSDGIATRLYLKAMAITAGETTFLLTTFDTCKYPDANLAREKIAEATGVPMEHIIVTASHGHSSPWYDYYGDALIDYLIEISKAALADRTPCTLYTASGTVENMTQNRRVIKNGVCWNVWLMPKEERQSWPPAAKHDKEVLSIAAKKPDGTWKAILFNFACHACTSGATPTLVSADYPGYVRLGLDEIFGYPVETLFWPGACGDINGTRDAKTLGGELARVIAESLQSAKPVDTAELTILNKTLTLNDRNVKVFNEDAVRAIWSGEVEHFRRDFEEYVELAQPSYPANFFGVRLGSDTAIVTDPTELFSEIGIQIKADSPFARTFVVEQTNGALGYLPTKKAFRQGGYETFYAEHSFLEEDAAEKIYDVSMELLRELNA